MNAHERADGSAPTDTAVEPKTAGGGCLHLTIFIVLSLVLLLALVLIFGDFGQV